MSKTTEILTSIIYRFKNLLIGLLVVLCVLIIGYSIFLIFTSNINKKNALIAESIINEFELYNESSDKNDAKLLEAIEAGKQTSKNGSTYIRALFTLAQLKEAQENKDESIEIYKSITKLNSKNYLVPIAMHKLAVYQEESDDIDSALETYITLSKTKNYFEKQRVLFNIARIFEQKENYVDARVYYNKIINLYSSNKDENSYSEFYKLALDRIILLDAKKM